MTTSNLIQNAAELTPSDFDNLNSCLILAPHPDDESLGCGGLIAMLRSLQKDVFVILMTDGSASHPNSQTYSPEARTAVRKEEAAKALEILGVESRHLFFLDKKDGALPMPGQADFEHSAHQLQLLILLLQPDLIVVPYEKDPHPDHRATWQLLMHARATNEYPYKVLEYLVWLHERGDAEDMPDKDFVRYVDIEPWLAQKQEAINSHTSQITNLFDDAGGFQLSPDMLSHFAISKEYYLDRQL